MQGAGAKIFQKTGGSVARELSLWYTDKVEIHITIKINPGEVIKTGLWENGEPVETAAPDNLD